MLVIKKESSSNENKNKDERLNFLWGFIGTNRTGKSVTALEHAKKWRANRPSSHSIIAFDPQRRFRQIADTFISPEDHDWAVRLRKHRNCLLILDDYRIINRDARPVKGLADLLYYRSDWNIDIIYICHSPSLILNILTDFTTNYFIFYTESMEDSFKKKIQNYKLCTKANRMINNYVHEHGRGEYPKFPHVVVDCENKELFAVNMKS